MGWLAGGWLAGSGSGSGNARGSSVYENIAVFHKQFFINFGVAGWRLAGSGNGNGSGSARGSSVYENIAVFHKLWAGWLVAGWLVVEGPKFMKMLRASRNLMVWGLAYKLQNPKS